MQAKRSAPRDWTRVQTRLGRRQALPVILTGVAGCLAAILQMWCVAFLLARALTGPGHSMAGGAAVAVPAALAGFVVAALLRAGLQAGGEVLAAGAGIAARRRLRDASLAAILLAGPSLLRDRHSSALSVLLVDRIEAVDGFFARWLPAASLAMLLPGLVLVAAAWIQPFAGLVLLCCGIAVPFMQAIFGIGAAAASRRQFQALARLQAYFVDRVRGIATLVLAGRTEDEALRLAAAAAELRRRTMRVLRVAFLSSAGLDCALAVALVVIALHDGGRLLRGAGIGASAGGPDGALSVARGLFVLLLVPEFFAPLRAFALAYQDRMQVAACADAFAGLPSPREDISLAAAGRRDVAVAGSSGGVAVVFESVRYGWSDARGPVLDGLSFSVQPGETLLLSGPSGAGKSTVIELLLGFARPQSGRVLVDGVDLHALAPAARSRMIGWIGQNPMLFAGSLRDNILFGRPDAGPDALRKAVAIAALEELVSLLPEGLETRIGEGGYGLSGGQAQRVAIARAALHDAPLLLLDEPTAHLDPDTERSILDRLQALACGRTVVMATHAQAAQRIAGRRIELGVPSRRIAMAGMEELEPAGRVGTAGA